jgi:hypothetical protein
VPVRIVSESLGAEVSWDGATEKVTLTKGGTLITMTIDRTAVYINGEQQELDVPATLVSGRTYVPLRFIAEAFGADVGYVDRNPFELRPLVWVDSPELLAERAIPAAESLSKTLELLHNSLELLLSELDLEEYDDDDDGWLYETVAYIFEDLAEINLVDEFSRFWVFGRKVEHFEGVAENRVHFFVDKYTGDIFVMGWFGEDWYGIERLDDEYFWDTYFSG